MEQVMFIVWRESVEAMLIVGILNAWLIRNPQAAAGRRYVWGGVVSGLLAACLLALGLFAASSAFADHQDFFQLIMVLLAAALIVQMVYWMRRHARTLRRDLNAKLDQKAQKKQWWGLWLLSTIAVAREGSETVIFLYGTWVTAESSMLWPMVLSALIGLALAALMYLLLQLGSKYLSWRLFFVLTEAMLLFLAAALFMNAIEKFIALDYLPALIDPVWNTSVLLDDSSMTGSVVSALTGYRAQPALTSLLGYGFFWIAVYFMLKKTRSQ